MAYETKTAAQVIAEAFAQKANGDKKALPILFKSLYNESPVGKEKFQQIARQFGEQKLETENGFLEFAEEVCFSGIEIETDSNHGTVLETTYKFDGLIGLYNIFN